MKKKRNIFKVGEYYGGYKDYKPITYYAVFEEDKILRMGEDKNRMIEFLNKLSEEKRKNMILKYKKVLSFQEFGNTPWRI